MQDTGIYEVEYDEEKRRVTVEVSLELYNDIVRWAKEEDTTPELFLQKSFVENVRQLMKKSI